MSDRQLIFLSTPDIDLAKTLRQNNPDCIVIYWNKSATDIVSAKILASSCTHILADASILQEVASELGMPVMPLIFPGKARLTVRSGEKSANRPIAFFVASDTIAKMLKGVTAYLNVPYFYILPSSKNEGAFESLLSDNVQIFPNTAGLLATKYPAILVLGNDWGGEEMDLIKSASRLKIPSVCIQEGCLDWQGEARRMQWATYPFIQGPITTEYLSREIYFLTGNPKFDTLTAVPLPTRPKVMVNCNFTYGIFEEERDRWLEDIATACITTGFDFFISQHPRDKKQIEKYPVKRSNASVVHSQIAESSILVSRFSTVIHEAVLMGRQAIYYNPHGEPMQLFNEDKTNGIYKASSLEELLAVFENLKNGRELKASDSSNFALLHCGSADGKASQRCANSIQEIRKWSGSFTVAFDRRIFYFIYEHIANGVGIMRHFVRNHVKPRIVFR
ncbi:hypothetical protein C4588_06965 [Candidatus Parcubacteria bacterium]|nr:MAG: hypothetical protein C4588_06965 [Candidatus Parcubacteria bacterium]